MGDDGSVLKRRRAAAAGSLRVFIAVGSEGKVMINGAKRLVQLLKRDPSINVGFQYMPKEDHATILHQAAMDGFRWMAGK